jgi:CheY-like chemotaxis protein
MNLCTNAAHAVGDQHGTIIVGQRMETIDADSLRRLLPAGTVCVSVRDTGHGMDRATMERVFEPFFTTKEPGVGTGLGLAVVHGIVRNHDGVALVESEPGAGTTFRLYFPLLAPVAAPSDGETGDVPRGAGERVLFVDDEPALAAVTSRILERLGYSVLALRSATEALSVFRANPSAFDLVISDLTMPGLTGAQLTVEMRRLRANVPVIPLDGLSRPPGRRYSKLAPGAGAADEAVHDGNAGDGRAAGAAGHGRLTFKPVIPSGGRRPEARNRTHPGREAPLPGGSRFLASAAARLRSE